MPDSTCPNCGGTGWKIVERAGISGALRCECASVRRGEALKENSKIPLNYDGASLENFTIPQDNPIAKSGLGKALMQSRAFARDFPAVTPPGLLFIGDTG